MIAKNLIVILLPMIQGIEKIKRTFLINFSFINKTILEYFQKHDLFV